MGKLRTTKLRASVRTSSQRETFTLILLFRNWGMELARNRDGRASLFPRGATRLQFRRRWRPSPCPRFRPPPWPGDRREAAADRAGKTAGGLGARAVPRDLPSTAATARRRELAGKPRASFAAARDSVARVNVPPPSATTVSRSSDSVRSRKAAVSASRNPGSPLVRKISGMLCRSRDSIRASRSTNCQRKRRASSWPTLLLPEAMNPTRNTARTPMALQDA